MIALPSVIMATAPRPPNIALPAVIAENAGFLRAVWAIDWPCKEPAAASPIGAFLTVTQADRHRHTAATTIFFMESPKTDEKS